MIRGIGYYRAGDVVTGHELSALVGEGIPANELRLRLAEAYEKARVDEEESFVWVGLHDPSPAELAAVEDVFSLDHLQVEDAANPRQRAKFDLEEDFAFALLKVLGYVESTSDVETGQIAVFTGRHYAVTVRHGVRGELTTIRSRLEAAPDLLRHGSASVLYGVIDAVVDGYLNVADEIQNDIEQVEELVFSPARTDDTQRIYELKRENLEVRRAVLPLVPIAHQWVAETVTQVPTDLLPFFRDIGDHVLRTNDLVDSSDSLLMTMLMAATARLDLQQNADMRKISAWVAIAAVPTALAAIYGMNFDTMPELHWALGYPMVLVVMATACVLLYRAFNHNG
ncbi:MAG: magnesium and cobalt transport protein CorA [Candidatus Nanopelagicales bacterium]